MTEVLKPGKHTCNMCTYWFNHKNNFVVYFTCAAWMDMVYKVSQMILSI